MKINMKRLMSNLHEIGKIGKTEDGYNRIEFSSEYFEAAEKFLDKLITGMDIDYKQLENGKVEIPIYRSFYLNQLLI